MLRLEHARGGCSHFARPTHRSWANVAKTVTFSENARMTGMLQKPPCKLGLGGDSGCISSRRPAQTGHTSAKDRTFGDLPSAIPNSTSIWLPAFNVPILMVTQAAQIRAAYPASVAKRLRLEQVAGTGVCEATSCEHSKTSQPEGWLQRRQNLSRNLGMPRLLD